MEEVLSDEGDNDGQVREVGPGASDQYNALISGPEVDESQNNRYSTPESRGREEVSVSFDINDRRRRHK